MMLGLAMLMVSLLFLMARRLRAVLAR
jgi:hypothetical protein